MLTREQLSVIAKRNNTGLAIQERDYIQSGFLYLLSRAGQDLRFKGGTCLRIVYGLNRFSEDLDFNFVNDRTRVESLFLGGVHNLKTFGIEASARDVKFFQDWFGFDLSFQGPLFDGRSITKSKIRVDVSMREEEVETDTPLIDLSHLYPDIPVFGISCLTVSHILAEKIRALFIREKPRDLYDVWFLLKKNIKPDISIINKKLALHDKVFEKKRILEVIDGMEIRWKQDLSALLSMVPEFNEVSREVINCFSNQEKE